MNARLSAPLDCTVIIPVHDDAEGALACFAALQQQDLPPDRFEVVFCDNASTAPLTQDALDLVGEHDVRVLTTTEPGSYRARNGGLGAGRGRVLAFTDADCLPAPGWLTNGLHRLEAGADIVAGDVQVTTRPRPSPLEVWEKRNAFPQEKYVRTMDFGVTANLFVRREVFDRVGPFAEHLMSGGDREFCQRAVRAGARIEYARDAAVSHPARTSGQEVAFKTRRVLQGAKDLGEAAPSRISWLRSARPPLGCLSRSRDAGPLHLRVLYVIGEMQAHYIRWWLTREVARG